jgi:hypothetical protein
MQDKVLLEHDDKLYAIAIDDLAPYEVRDSGLKAELEAERDAALAASDDEVEGFAKKPSGVILIRR